MKTSDFVIFISIVLVIYTLVHVYVFIRGYQSLPDSSLWRVCYTVLFMLLAMSYIAGRFTERLSVCKLSTAFIWIGSFWLGIIFYLFLFVLVFDLIRAANYFVGFFPSFINENYPAVKFIAALSVFGITAILVIAGFINTHFPRVHTISLQIPKKSAAFSKLNIAIATDIHMGTLISNSRVDTLVEKLNSCEPDIVILGGDIVDEDLAPIIENNLGEQLRGIKAKHGIFAVTGNHEYIGGVEKACRYLSEHGITMLRDEYVKINDSFYLIGREDISSTRFAGKNRKSLESLLVNTDKKSPLILVDHQPFKVHEAAEYGVDVMISGHTHAGQLWPIKFIIDMIYTVGSGFRKIGNTNVLVSTGFGTWGPPVRIGNRPEIINLRLEFKE